MAPYYLILKVTIEEEFALAWVGIEKVLYEYRRTRCIFKDIEVSFLIGIAITIIVAQGMIGEILLHGIEECLCYGIT